MTSLRVAPIASIALVVCAGCHEPRPTSTEAHSNGPPPVASAPHPSEAVEIPTIHPVLADPRLGAARQAAQNRDWVTAAAALGAAEAALTPDSRTPAEKCAWAYLEGRIYLAAGQPRDATQAFD